MLVPLLRSMNSDGSELGRRRQGNESRLTP